MSCCIPPSFKLTFRETRKETLYAKYGCLACLYDYMLIHPAKIVYKLIEEFKFIDGKHQLCAVYEEIGNKTLENFKVSNKSLTIEHNCGFITITTRDVTVIFPKYKDKFDDLFKNNDIINDNLYIKNNDLYYRASNKNPFIIVKICSIDSIFEALNNESLRNETLKK